MRHTVNPPALHPDLSSHLARANNCLPGAATLARLPADLIDAIAQESVRRGVVLHGERCDARRAANRPWDAAGH